MASTVRIGGSLLDLSTASVMAVINVTPDSFYAPSRQTSSTILEYADKAISEGAAILDIGGCSTRPGAVFPSAEEEYSRVREAFSLLRSRFPDFPLSLDSFRSEVVRRIVEEFGPVLVNDISAGQDPDMLRTVSDLGLPYVLCHMPVPLSKMHQPCHYDYIVSDMLRFFAEKFRELSALGIYDIIIDPNFGFAKDIDQNLKVVEDYRYFKCLSLPLMAGISHKRFVRSSPNDPLETTSAIHMSLLQSGARLLRVHDTATALTTIKQFYEITKE